ncbi:MFS transporter [Micromonospora sp. IBHARD004]|uniref:MFS transporter n=1 Tax=Micromonospora sp. IBHARD004 TaxID=3457764 RepID=UPI004059E36F
MRTASRSTPSSITAQLLVVPCPADRLFDQPVPVRFDVTGQREVVRVRRREGALGVAGGRSLGWRFGWLWASYAVSTFGTRLAFGAFPLIAILVLHAGPTEVAVLAAAGLAVGAAVAVPLGPWVEFRRKRPVMVAMDLARFVALMSVPAAFALGWLSFVQLLVVSVIVAAADITFNAASGAYLKALVRPRDLLVANGRFEATNWTATVLGPPLGGAAIGLFGPVMTVVADAVSYLLSAVGIRAIGGSEPRAVRADAPPRLRAGDLLDGWRHILTHPALRPLFFNTILVSSLIMATSPLLAVLMLGHLGFAPWQYGLAFALPCVGGLIGSRLARRLVARFGQRNVMLTAGALRACWSLGLAFIRPGAAGLVLVMAVELGLITCMGVFNPVFATYRLDHTAADRVARTLTAWSVTSKATIAAMTALWGLLAGITSPRTAIAIAGLLILTTPLLLPRHDHVPQHERELVQSHR